MLFDQALHRQVSQNIAAIGDERIAAKLPFDILNPATRFEKHRLIDKLERQTAIFVFGKYAGKRFRLPVSVDDKLFDAAID